MKTNVLEEVLTNAEAAELYNLSEGTIRNAIKTGRFTQHLDYRKAGRITLITKKAMDREYGDNKNPCDNCAATICDKCNRK